MNAETDILSSPEATFDVVRCANEECHYELLDDEIEEQSEDTAWWTCPECGEYGQGVEVVKMTLQERLDQWHASMDELIDSFNMIGERIPSLRPRLEREVEATRKMLKLLMPFVTVDLGPHVQIRVTKDGDAEWRVTR